MRRRRSAERGFVLRRGFWSRSRVFFGEPRRVMIGLCAPVEEDVREHGRVTGLSTLAPHERGRQRKPRLPLGRHKIHLDQRERRPPSPSGIVGY
jgi:hypothetical protein